MTDITDYPAFPDFLLVANRKPLTPELQAKQDAIVASLRETRQMRREVDLARERADALAAAVKRQNDQPRFEAMQAKAAEDKAEKERIATDAKAKLAAWKKQHGWK